MRPATPARSLELQARHSELEQVLQEMRTARDHAELASRAKSEFLAVMSHELRTPLNGVIGYAELIQRGVAGQVTPEQDRYLERIRAGAQQLAGIIDDILVFSREGSQPRPVETEPVALSVLVSEVLDGVLPAAREKGLRLEQEVAEGLSIRTDRERLRRILANLASNAVKFTAEGSVELSAYEEGEAIIVQVRDTGIGIAPENRERVFDPFWQVDQSSTRSQSGTGLGLSIVKRLAEQLEGTIEIDSRPGEGSTFMLRLPRELDTQQHHTMGQRKST